MRALFAVLVLVLAASAAAADQPAAYGLAQRGSLKVVSNVLLSPTGGEMKGVWIDAKKGCRDRRTLRVAIHIDLVTPAGKTIRVKRYYRTDDSPRSARPTVVSSRLTLDEVKDASGKVSSAALEAALVETNAGFDLSKKAVTDLASAGVSGRVIDLLVALSYPEKFAIQAVGQAGGAPVPTVVGFGSPYYYDPFYYGYGSPYLYEPFGYRGYIFVDGGVGGGGGGVSGGQQPSVGRVINGQGYTRIVPRDTVPNTTTQTGRTASTSGSSGSDSGSSSSSSSSSSGSSSSSSGSSGGGGGATVSPSGASSSGSSDSGRTAVPR